MTRAFHFILDWGVPAACAVLMLFVLFGTKGGF